MLCRESPRGLLYRHLLDVLAHGEDSNYNYVGDDEIGNFISTLHKILAIYKSFIEDVDSSDFNTYRSSNCLNPYNYIITHDLEDSLKKGETLELKDRKINKGKGLYLVNFNKLDSKTIIYKYIKYNPIFTDCLINYVTVEQMYAVSQLYPYEVHNVGSDYLFFTQDTFNWCTSKYEPDFAPLIKKTGSRPFCARNLV